MKTAADNDLNALSSWLLGIMGIFLILIPSHLNPVFSSIPQLVLTVTGTISFTASLANQVLFVLDFHSKRVAILRGLSGVLLLIFAALYFEAGLFVAGSILCLVGTMQIIMLTPPGTAIKEKNPFQITVIMIGFACGIYLSISGGLFEKYGLTAYATPLVIGFLATAFIGATAFIIPSIKYNRILSRLAVIPWLVWCVLFYPHTSAGGLLPIILLAMMILANGFLPWNRLNLTNEDILGRRLVMIASTLELTLLIFLGALLTVLDHSVSVINAPYVTAREAAFLFFIVISTVMYYEVSTIIMTINGLMHELTRMEDEEQEEITEDTEASGLIWNSRLSRYIKPFLLSREGLRVRLVAQADQIQLVSRQLANEKKRNAQLTLLMELSQQLENQLDQPVSAQIAVNTLERALKCSLACLYIHEPEQGEFMLLAAAGEQTSIIPSGYRQSNAKGVIGRAVRQRKTQIVSDIREDSDYITFDKEPNLSAVVIPLMSNGHVNGAILINSLKVNAFGSIDISLAEAVAAELTRAWERSGYHQRLMNLIQAGSQLSSMVEPESTAMEVASIAREILKARFTFVHIQLGQERNFNQSAFSGEAPGLLKSLENSARSNTLFQSAFQAVQPFRVRDVRKFNTTSHLAIDHPGLRSMLIIPIRWHRINIGAIFAFGKQNEVFFSENDESLAELLSIQTAGAFESTWLQQELRSSLRITSLLYRLSNQIIQSENLEDAASDIAQTAHKLAKSLTTGIVLLNPEGNIMAEMTIDANGTHHGGEHPLNLIKDAMTSGQHIHFSQGHSIIRTCLPIQTTVQKYGALWMDGPEDHGHKPTANSNDLQALVNQAAIALERSLLLVESHRQAVEIKAAYDKLEVTYDQTLASLMSALDARDQETEGHSIRVAHLVAKLGEALGFSAENLKALERGSLLHDIGKIGVSDTILHKPGPLSEEEWKIMKLHPGIGAKIVEGIPFLEDTIPLIRHHQERWNGTGYPNGLRGEEIPILARIFAIVDAFDALTSKRPYRQKISALEAVEYLREQAGILFDPQIVDVFESLIIKSPRELEFFE